MNWIVGNLQNALDTWNGKLSEIYMLVTQSPADFKGGAIWNIILNINGALQAIGLALLVLFFVVGVARTCTNFSELKRPEQALKLFLRFAIAKGIVTYGLELMLAVFKIIQGIVTTIRRIPKHHFFKEYLLWVDFLVQTALVALQIQNLLVNYQCKLAEQLQWCSVKI